MEGWVLNDFNNLNYFNATHAHYGPEPDYPLHPLLPQTTPSPSPDSPLHPLPLHPLLPQTIPIHPLPLHPLLPQTIPYTLSFPRLSPTPSPPTPFPSPLPLHLRVHCARLTTISKPISGEWKWVRKPFNSASASVQASQAYTTVFPCPCSTLTLPVSCVSGRLAVYLH